MPRNLTGLHRGLSFTLFLLGILLGACPLFAQSAAVQGAVVDESGATIAEVDIVIKNLATGATHTARSNSQGLYSVPLLSPGNYSVEATKEGFSTARLDSIKLDVGQITRVDLALKVGTVTERVQVSAVAPLLESESTSMGQVIENKRIAEMPLNLRNYLELSKFAAGVLPARTLGRGARTGGEDGTEGGFIALGMRAYQTNVLLDGVDNSSRASGGPLGFQAQAVKPPVDTVEEFKVVTNNNSAEYGYRMGPKVLVSTRSGGNGLHGGLYEFFRNDALDATNFFANRAGSTKPALRQNQFGGTVGGPIIRDRTFYFVSYQGTRIRRGRSFTSSVPSALARGGNFSLEGTSRNLIFDPLTTTGSGADARRQPFANNVIPSNRFDPVARSIIDLYPLPNVAGREYLANNYFFAPNDVDDSNQLDIKVDHTFTEKDRTFYRWSRRRDNKLQNGPLPLSAQGGGLGQTVNLPADNIAAGWTHTFSPRIFNEARFGFTHYPTRFDILDTENLNEKYGVKGAPGDTFDDGLDHGLARFTPAGYNEIGSRSFWPNRNWLDNLQFNDNVLFQLGSHSLKFGGEYRRADIFREAQRFRRGQFTFNKVYTSEFPNNAASRNATGNGLADMMLGWASQTTVGNQLSEDIIVPYWGFYIQDDWKVARNLTVNVGLRWELFQGPYFPEGTNIGRLGVSRYLTEFNVSPSDPSYQTFQRPANGSDCGCKQNWNNYSPRLGIAYKIGEKTVIRSGFGIFYGESDYATSENARWINQTPDFTEVAVNGTNVTQAAFIQNGFAPVQLPAAAPVPGTTVEVSKDEFPTQYSTQWFFDVQRELPSNILLTLGYQASKSTHLFAGRNINNGGPHPSIPENQRRVRPSWNSVTLRDNGANANYNAFVARGEKRFSKGVTFLASYTWSHTIDQSEESLDEGLSGRANEYNLSAERGNSSLDRRHNFVASFTWELPFGKGRRFGSSWAGPVDFVLGGWQLGGILSLRTGTPFDISYPGDPQNSGTRNRGNRIASGTLDNPTIDRWFDENAFVLSAPGVFGNTGRNVLYGPGQKNFDLIVGKQFRLPWEGHIAQFRFESFNVTNTANFGQPNGTLRSAATASITTADDPRRIQLALKYNF